MRFVSFAAEGRASFGLIHGQGVFDLGRRLGAVIPDLHTYLEAASLGLAGALPKPGTVDYAAGQFDYLPPIADPAKVICVGVNYVEHRAETGRPEIPYPTLFTRWPDTFVGHGAPIRLPANSASLDYEGELAVVIGKPGHRVPKEKAMELVAGFACFNDASVRDWQRHASQFTPGKNFIGTGGFGPELVTPDEVAGLDGRAIATRLNGQVVQSATLGDMIFGIPAIIEYITAFTRLAPGDVIATGTPGGVGERRKPQLWMKAGDSVEVSIDGVGKLVNPIAPEGN
jgi:2-keto-4-pentenoate hydratase/2-oxohepta-3-ene-1,7-dioic acid hydratase in catechol pathway